MKAEYINPFIKAVVEVLKIMAFTKAKASKPYLKKDDLATGDVSAIVGMTGQSNGTFSLSFDEKSVLTIASNMFGEKITKLDRDVTEVVGEIANMVSGQARRELEAIGLVLDGAIPSVFGGSNHNILHFTEGPKIAIPFTLEGGAFTMEVCFEF
ncbi:MAG: chemotaxis protein CheX [Proteobacteria bacterium]|nr:chemotaxis protein CheX [Pseudomonadota bacterium]